MHHYCLIEVFCKHEDGPISFSKSGEFPWLEEHLSP